MIFASLVLGAALLKPACAQLGTSVLLIQQTPSTGGVLTPKVGVHHFGENEKVALWAMAEPGYQFVYWLGDVGEPTAPRTVVQLDGPKIVIAVFERSRYELLDVEATSMSSPVGGLIPAVADVAGGGSVAGGRQRPRTMVSATQPEPNDSPAQDTADDGQTPVPEPATLMLLLLGGILAHRRTRNKKYLTSKVR
jgi:hypothetical protein